MCCETLLTENADFVRIFFLWETFVEECILDYFS